MHVYLWEHIVHFYYRTAGWIFTKLERDKVLMAPHLHLRCFSHICQGADPGQSKNRSRWGLLLKKNFFRSEGYYNKPNASQLFRNMREEVLLFLVPF